jgi:hypothetical protein
MFSYTWIIQITSTDCPLLSVNETVAELRKISPILPVSGISI